MFIKNRKFAAYKVTLLAIKCFSVLDIFGIFEHFRLENHSFASSADSMALSETMHN